MRVFKLDIGGEYETIAAKNLLEAIEFYLELTGDNPEELSDVEEIPRNQWESMIVRNPDYNQEDELDQLTYTVAEMLDGVTEACHISSTYIG